MANVRSREDRYVELSHEIPHSGCRGAAVASFTTTTSKPCSSKSRGCDSTHMFASIPPRMTLPMRRLRSCRTRSLVRAKYPVRADNDRLAVFNVGLEALEPVGA